MKPLASIRSGLRRQCCFLALLGINVIACAAEPQAISISNGYVRGLPPGVANTAAYMTISNTGSEDYVLVGGSTDIAESVSAHATVNDNGMMSMEHRMQLTIPAGGEVILESGGLHLMLMGLKKTPVDTVPLTLQFQNGESLDLILPVISVLDE